MFGSLTALMVIKYWLILFEGKMVISSIWNIPSLLTSYKLKSFSSVYYSHYASYCKKPGLAPGHHSLSQSGSSLKVDSIIIEL